MNSTMLIEKEVLHKFLKQAISNAEASNKEYDKAQEYISYGFNKQATECLNRAHELRGFVHGIRHILLSLKFEDEDINTLDKILMAR